MMVLLLLRKFWRLRRKWTGKQKRRSSLSRRKKSLLLPAPKKNQPSLKPSPQAPQRLPPQRHLLRPLNHRRRCPQIYQLPLRQNPPHDLSRNRRIHRKRKSRGTSKENYPQPESRKSTQKNTSLYYKKRRRCSFLMQRRCADLNHKLSSYFSGGLPKSVRYCRPAKPAYRGKIF